MDFDLKTVVGTLAPTLAQAMGGPLVGTAVSVIGKALGFENASEKDIVKRLQNLTPEQVVAIRKADLDFQTRMKELDIDLAKINMEDRSSAREREVVTGDSNTPRWLSIGALIVFGLLTIATFGLVWFFSTQSSDVRLPSELWMLLSTLVGLAGSLATQSYSYYLGSNADASSRDAMIFNSNPTEQKLMDAAASALHASTKNISVTNKE